MNYSFLALQFIFLQCIQEAQYIALQMGNGGSEFERSQGTWKAKSQVIRDSMRKTPKTFGFMHISRCTWVLAQMFQVHAGVSLKVMYTHK